MPRSVFGRRRPLQHLLAPIHTHVVLHISGDQHFAHRRVPVRIVGVRRGELFVAIDVNAAIAAVLGEGLPGPLR